MMQLKSRTLVDAMREEDIPEVQAIERQIFPTPWPRNAYYRELHHNRSAYYLVLRRDEEIVGYAGLWKMSDEAHITTVGVRANQQGKGYGHALMAALIQRAYQLGSRWLTLEVRPSKSRSDQGLIKVRTTTLNQDGEAVQILVGNLLVRRRA